MAWRSDPNNPDTWTEIEKATVEINKQYGIDIYREDEKDEDRLFPRQYYGVPGKESGLPLAYATEVMLRGFEQECQKRGDHLFRCNGRDYVVLKNVFSPRCPYAGQIAEWGLTKLKFKPGSRLLVIGAGCGFVGIEAILKHKVAEVWMTDVSDEAIACMKRNVEKFKVKEKVTILKKDVFDDLDEKEKFDMIYWSYPGFSIELEDYRASTLTDTLCDRDGDRHEPLNRYFEDARWHLKDGGELWLNFPEINKQENFWLPVPYIASQNEWKAVKVDHVEWDCKAARILNVWAYFWSAMYRFEDVKGKAKGKDEAS